MKIRVITVALAVVAAALIATPPVQGADEHEKNRTVAYDPPPIDWDECGGVFLEFDAVCGRLVVPMDYADPEGPSVSLAVIKVLHESPDADYQGVMFASDGGTWVPGREAATQGRYAGHDSGDPFDWVGFDPRGVGSSTPSLSCNPKVHRGDRPPYVPKTRAIMKRWVKRSTGYARKCADAAHSKLFAHLTTEETAQDLESFRKALGVEQFSIFAISHSTYLATVYATLYPERVDRLVLDGTVDPTGVHLANTRAQDIATERVARSYFQWLANHRDRYHVGKTRLKVRQKYFATMRKLDRKAAKGYFGGSELTDVFIQFGSTRAYWQGLGDAYSRYVVHGKVDRLAEFYYDPTRGVYQPPYADAEYAVRLGTQCTDAPWPHRQQKLTRASWKLHRAGNAIATWSNTWLNNPCTYWHFESREKRFVVDGSGVTGPVLMFAETYDGVTPFAGSLTVRDRFPGASLVEGVRGTTHRVSLSGMPCTDDLVATYLSTGVVPERQPGRGSDLVCPPHPA